MKEYRFTHSFWSKPMIDNKYRLEANAWMYALSLAYLKKLGCVVSLHTGTLGARLLKDIGYDAINLTAEEIPGDISPKIFAYIKSMALDREPLGTVHIDGDVLIKKQECLDRIFEHDCDCVVQSCETVIDWKEKGCSFMMPFLSENLLSTGERLDIKYYDFNVGVIGFFNSELKDLYIQNYQNLTQKLSKYPYLYLCNFDRGHFGTPDVVLEQNLISQLTETYKTRFVLPVDSGVYDEDRNNIAKEIGYAHLLGDAKWQQDNVKKIRHRLLEIDPECFEKVSKNIKEVLYESK